ncbi:tetratricopeptide repeat-containing sensor histidine kinase [Saccharicrinis sp. 156]|uniref:tetratricopeptide repeat-containing sensor histidine kinase n=1 Tax=Saccharicrinis sp. 156 TaxID=3417574 RepID=UPI003D343E36
MTFVKKPFKSNNSSIYLSWLLLFLGFAFLINTHLPAQNITNDTKEDSIRYIQHATLAQSYLNRHQYDSTFKHGQLALELSENIWPAEKVHLYGILGQAHYFTGDHQKAIDGHLKALKLCDDFSLDSLKPKIFIDLSNVHIRLGNWGTVQKYLHQAIHQSKEFGQTEFFTKASSNLGMVYGMQNKTDSALIMFESALDAYGRDSSILSVSKIYNNLGVVYERKLDNTNAYIHYKKALEIAQAVNDKASVAIGYQNVGHALSKLERYHDAMEYFQKGLQLSRELNYRDIERDGLYNLSVLYENMGNYKKALEVRTQFINLHDSLVNDKNLKAVSELEIKYRSEKKGNEILALKNANLEHEAKIQAQKKLIRIVMGIVLLLVVLSIFVFVIYRQHQQNKLQQDAIRLITETQEEERQRIASDLHDSVGSLIASLKINLTNTTAITEERDLHLLDELSREVRSIAHNIMPGTLKKMGLVAAIKSELKRVEEVYSHHTIFTEFGYENRQNLMREIQIFRIFQEVLQNAIKHANAQNINIQLTNNKKNINLIVEDDGIGFDSKNVELKNGLSSISYRIKILNGKFNIDSFLGRGTLVNISIPIQG